MRYSLGLCFKRMVSKKLLYTVIILQMAVGINFLSASLDAYHLENLAYEKAKEQLSNKNIAITILDGFRNNPIDALSVKDYKKLKNKYKDKLNINMIKVITYRCMIFDNEVDQSSTINMIFVNDGYLGLNIQANTVYASKKILDEINRMNTYKEDFKNKKSSGLNLVDEANIDFKIRENKLTIANHEYDIKPSPESIKKVDFSRFESVGQDRNLLTNGNDVIFLSLEEYDKYKEHNEEDHEVFLSTWSSINAKEIDESNQYIYDMVEDLKNLNGAKKENMEGMEFMIDSSYLQLKETLMQKLSVSINKMAIAISLLLLVSISSAGILYLIMLNRKKSIAISIMLGSSKKIQKLELFFEVYFICFIGVMLGVLSYYFTNNAPILSLFTIKYIVLSALIMGLLSSSLSLIGINKLTPIEILQSL